LSNYQANFKLMLRKRVNSPLNFFLSELSLTYGKFTLTLGVKKWV